MFYMFLYRDSVYGVLHLMYPSVYLCFNSSQKVTNMAFTCLLGTQMFFLITCDFVGTLFRSAVTLFFLPSLIEVDLSINSSALQTRHMVLCLLVVIEDFKSFCLFIGCRLSYGSEKR